MSEEHQYALVHGGTVLLLSKAMTAPPDADDFPPNYPADSQWLRVENVDSQPFNAAQHWRLEPRYEVTSDTTGDHVSRVYPVVRKSWEHA